jgi:hypothetical protein
MSSKYLNSLSAEEYQQLTEKLWNIQNKTCFICCDAVDLDLHSTNIDHIVPLANRGKDAEENFAVTHESCNKSKQDSDLKIARILHKLKKIQDTTFQREGKSASLKHVLAHFGGSKFDFRYKLENGNLLYSFSETGNNDILKSSIFTDHLSKIKTSFIETPIEYIHHDELINPRGINNSISKLIKEFAKENPQLHMCLARFDDNKIKVFDGQHKAVAQILLGTKRILLRVFVDADVDVLTETNTNAGSVLRQIAFDKSIMRQLNNTLFLEKIKQYQIDHDMTPDDLSFSEQKLVDYFKGDNANIKKYIIDNLKHSITEAPENKLKEFIDREGKAKDLPISYSAFDKTFLSFFVDNKKILSTPINYKSDEGLNPRELEIGQLIKLSNIIADEIYVNKFSPEIGIYRLEDKIIKGLDSDISDDHLVAYRISKEEIMYNWLLFLKAVIKNYFSNTGKIYDENSLFQQNFDEQLWTNIRNFIVNLAQLPLWKDRSKASTAFTGKKNYDYWKSIFTSGSTPEGVAVLAKPLNYVEMIMPNC